MSLYKSLVLDPSVCRIVSVGRARVAVAAPVAAPPVPEQRGPDLDAIRREAYAAGEAKTRQELSVVSQQQTQRWEQFQAKLDAYLDGVELQVNEQTVNLALKVAELIVRHTLPDEAMIRSLVRESLDRITDLDGIKVRMYPQDIEMIRGASGADASGKVNRVELVPDMALQPGDIVVENGFGYFDARVSQRLEMLKDQLVDRVRKAHADGNAS